MQGWISESDPARLHYLCSWWVHCLLALVHQSKLIQMSQYLTNFWTLNQWLIGNSTLKLEFSIQYIYLSIHYRETIDYCILQTTTLQTYFAVATFKVWEILKSQNWNKTPFKYETKLFWSMKSRDDCLQHRVLVCHQDQKDRESNFEILELKIERAKDERVLWKGLTVCSLQILDLSFIFQSQLGHPVSSTRPRWPVLSSSLSSSLFFSASSSDCFPRRDVDTG